MVKTAKIAFGGKSQASRSVGEAIDELDAIHYTQATPGSSHAK